MPFREAYNIVGRMVKFAIENNKTLEDFKLEEFKEFSNLFDEDIYEEINIVNCVKKRNVMGGPAPDRVKEHIERYI